MGTNYYLRKLIGTRGPLVLAEGVKRSDYAIMSPTMEEGCVSSTFRVNDTEVKLDIDEIDEMIDEPVHNYYQVLHIGKDSGYMFTLKAIPWRGIHNLEDWRERWSQPGTSIVDEYDREVTVEKLEAIICKAGRGDPEISAGEWE